MIVASVPPAAIGTLDARGQAGADSAGAGAGVGGRRARVLRGVRAIAEHDVVLITPEVMPQAAHECERVGHLVDLVVEVLGLLGLVRVQRPRPLVREPVHLSAAGGAGAFGGACA